MSYRVESQTFKTLEEAKACAQRFFARRGVIVAITAVKTRKR